MAELDLSPENLIERLKQDADVLNTGGFLKKRYNFSQVSNMALDDESMSIDARGLYSVIQRWITYYENNRLDKTFLRKKCATGEVKFDRMWKELKKFGYLKQYKISAGKNKFIYVYDLLDKPNMENTETISMSLKEFNKQNAQ